MIHHMKEQLEVTLKNRYPIFFKMLQDRSSEQHTKSKEQEPVYTPVKLFGIQCDDGWYKLIDKLANRIERINSKETTTETIHATQVKEKFGALRVYTSHQPSVINELCHFARELSRETCELCGDMQTARKRDIYRIKTLCDAHYYAEIDVSDKINIYTSKMDCFNCQQKFSVAYPAELGSDAGGAWNLIGEELSEAEYANVERVFSNTQNMYVWGNICPYCDRYSGNYFVHKHFSKRPSDKTHVDTLKTNVSNE